MSWDIFFWKDMRNSYSNFIVSRRKKLSCVHLLRKYQLLLLNQINIKKSRDIRRTKREKQLMKQKYQHQRIFGPSLTKTEVQLKRNMQQTRTIQLSLINYFISIFDVRKDKVKILYKVQKFDFFLWFRKLLFSRL